MWLPSNKRGNSNCFEGHSDMPLYHKIQKNFMQYFPRKTALGCSLGNMVYFNWKYIDFQESGFAICY